MDQYAILCGMADIADAILSYSQYVKTFTSKTFLRILTKRAYKL